MQEDKKLQILEFLRNTDIDAILFWHASDLLFATGKLPHWGLSIFLFTKDGEQEMLVPYLEPEDSYYGIDKVSVFGWGNWLCENPWNDLYSKLKNMFSKHGIKKLGIPTSHSHTTLSVNSAENAPYPVNFLSSISSLVDVVCISDKLSLLEMFKTENDILKIKKVAGVAELAIECFYKMLLEGNTDVQIAAEIERVVRMSVDGKNIKLAQAWAFINAGVHSPNAWMYGRNVCYTLKSGDAAMLELGICVDGYWADISRTGFVNEPSAEYKKLYALVEEAQSIAMNMLAPSVKACDVHGSVTDFFKKNNIEAYYQHATGHHVGFRYHDCGFMINKNSSGIFESGMIVTIEPGIYIPSKNFGCRIEDDILITDNGFENLSKNLKVYRDS